MLTPYLAILLYFMVIIWVRPSVDGDRVLIVLGLVLVVLGGALVWVMGWGLSELIGESAAQEMDSKPSSGENLISLRSADGISGSFHGSFFLGMGSIGSDMYYFYYVSAGKNRYQPKKHRVGGGTYVYEEDFDARPDGPYMEVFSWHFKRKWLHWFAADPSGTTTYFHVPKGSILRGYTLQ